MAPEGMDQMYSFICNAIIGVYNCQVRERLCDIGVLCSEVTAHYKALTSEWITVLKALCFAPGTNGNSYMELMDEVDLSDTSVHESICLFTTTLISRSCFSLEDLVKYTLLPSLRDAVDSGNKIIPEAEFGSQLACQLLFRLLDQSTVDKANAPYNIGKFSYEPTPDRALLCAAQENIPVVVIFNVLKALMKFSEAERRNEHEESSDEIFRGFSFNGMDDLVDVGPGQSTDVFSSSLISNKSVIENTSASAYANNILQKLCSQEWLKEKCLRDHDTLFSAAALLDPNITDVQAKKLLHLICHPNSFPPSFGVPVDGFPSSSCPEMESCKESANRILKNLNHWSFRNSWLELYLMLNKADKEKMELLLDCISSACLSLFVERNDSPKSQANNTEKQDDFIKGPEWLVEPLINKLSRSLPGHILKTAGDILGVKGWWKDHKDTGGPTLVHTQPFLHLILSCLQPLGEQVEPLLTSLLKQFQDLLEAPMEESHPADKKSKAFLQDALDLRLKLVGVMFGSIANPKNLHVASEWATALFDLISSGILSTECITGNFNHYTNVLDMLSVLINVITSTEWMTNQLTDDGRKLGTGLFKRLKRKLFGKNPCDIEHCKQLLPFPGRSIEVVTVEKSQQNDFSILSESQTSSLETEETQEGFQIKGRQKISPWDLIEGHKNPAPMAFSWFGAVRIERKPLPHLTDLPRSLHHNFLKKKPLSYYLNPPDDSEDDTIDLNSGLGSPGKLQSTLDPKGAGRPYTSMINLNAAVKRERLELRHAAVEQRQIEDKPKSKRLKKTARSVQQQQQPLTMQPQQQQQQKLLMFQQAERSFPEQSQPQTTMGAHRLQRPQGKQFSMVQPVVLLPKSQPDHLPQRASTNIQAIYSNRAQTLPSKQIVSQPQQMAQKRRNVGSTMHVEESPIQQLLQSAQAYQFNATQSAQLPVASHSVLSGASSTLTGSPSLANTFSSRAFSGASVQQQQQQQLNHQPPLDQQPLQQSFVLPGQTNLQQSSTLLQHPMTSTSLRLNPIPNTQQQFSQSGMNLSNQQELRACLLRQSTVAAQNPVTTQVNLQRQMSAPAKLSLSAQFPTAGDVSFQGQIAQSQNLSQSGQNQQYSNFQPFQ